MVEIISEEHAPIAMQTILVEIQFPWKYGTIFGYVFLGTLTSDHQYRRYRQLVLMLYEFFMLFFQITVRTNMLGAAIGFLFGFYFILMLRNFFLCPVF